MYVRAGKKDRPGIGISHRDVLKLAGTGMMAYVATSAL